MIQWKKIISITMVGVFTILSSCNNPELETFNDIIIPTYPIRHIETNFKKAIALNNEEYQVIDSVNEVRRAAALPSLTANHELMTAAVIRAHECEQKFSHTRPDGSEFWTVDSNVCYGECLARNYTSQTVVSAWLNSPPHRAIILDGSFSTIGIGIYKSSNGEIFIALEVGY